MLWISSISLLIFCGCNNDNATVNKIENIPDAQIDTVEKNSNTIVSDLIKLNFCEVVRLEYYNRSLQRIFVVISPDAAGDILLIQQAICTFQSVYPVDNHISNVSFFSDKKFAGYKDELFFSTDKSLPKHEYAKWLDFYYLGEFNFQAMEYVTYPASYQAGKQKRLKIKNCP